MADRDKLAPREAVIPHPHRHLDHQAQVDPEIANDAGRRAIQHALAEPTRAGDAGGALHDRILSSAHARSAFLNRLRSGVRLRASLDDLPRALTSAVAEHPYSEIDAMIAEADRLLAESSAATDEGDLDNLRSGRAALQSECDAGMLFRAEIIDPSSIVRPFLSRGRDYNEALSCIRADYARQVHFAKYTRSVLGIKIIGKGASAEAIDRCAALVEELFGHSPSAQRRARATRLTVVVIPDGHDMRESYHFASVVDEELAGVANVAAPDGSRAVAIPEWDLVAPSLKRRLFDEDHHFSPLEIATHELGHEIELLSLSTTQRQKVGELFEERRRAGGPWLTKDAELHVRASEYFADCVDAFYDRLREKSGGRAWLQTNDPAMFALIDAVQSGAQ